MPKFAENKIVFINATLENTMPCKVLKYGGIDSRVNKPVYILKGMGGTFCVPEDEIFTSLDEAREVRKANERKAIDEVKEEIEDVEGLLTFGFYNDLNGYINHKAYVERAKELLDIEL